MNLIIGKNGSGKTHFLEEKLYEYAEKNRDIITNVDENTEYNGFDHEKIRILENTDDFDLYFDYGTINIDGNTLSISGETIPDYSNSFMNILRLILRKGDYLVLDEPEYGLKNGEIKTLYFILNSLLKVFKDGYIATHCPTISYLNYDNIYLISKYNITKITEDDAYEYINNIRG